MSTLLRQLFLATVVLVAAVAAWCYPTIYGDTGLIQVPTADVAEYTHLNFAIDYTQVNSPNGKYNMYPFRMVYGIGSNSEFYACMSQSTGTQGTKLNVTGGGAKLAIFNEDVENRTPGVAVGIRAFRERDDHTVNVIEGYGVVSKALFSRGNLTDEGFVVRAHVGASFTSYSGDMKANFGSVFAGLNFRQVNGLGLAVDFIPAQKKDDVIYRSATVSAVVRYPLSDNFYVEFGSTKPFKADQNEIYSGVMYNFGGEAITTKREPVLY